MLLDVVRELMVYSRSGGVRGRALDRVCELMVVLRRAGFSSGEIERLSGGRWPASNIRTYSAGWGGVDDSLLREKEDVLSTLRELASSGRGVDDVSAVLALDRSVKARGSSLEEVAELWGYLREDVQPGEVGEMLGFYRGAMDEGLSPAIMKVWKKQDDELAGLGFNKGTRDELLKASEASGSVPNAIMNLWEYNRLADKRAAARQAEAAAEEAKLSRVEEEALYNQFKQGRVAFENLLYIGWSYPALLAAPETLKSADTQEKQFALVKHLAKFEYVEVSKEMRLVRESKAQQIDPHVLAETFQRLRSRDFALPLDGEQLIDLIGTLMEKLPGITIGDYAHYLLSIPNATDQEKMVAEKLVSFEEETLKAEASIDPDDLGAKLDMYRLQYRIFRELVHPKISKEITSVRNMAKNDPDTHFAYLAIRDSEILRNLNLIISDPLMVKLTSEEAAGYVARMLTFLKAKVDSDPEASKPIKNAVDEVEKHLSVLNPYWAKTWEEIQERSRRRMKKVKN